MKKIISLILVAALAVSLFIMPVSAASITDSVTKTDRFYNAVKYVEDNNIFQAGDVTESNAKKWLEGDTTRGEYALWLARFAGAELSTASAQSAEYVLDTTNDLAEMAAGTKADGETEVVADYFTVHYGAKTKIDGSKKSFEDGYEATQRLNFQGKTVFGDTVSYAVSFTTSAAATVKIWWVAGGDGREFTLFDANGNALSATSVGAVKNSLYISELSVDAAGTYYLGLETGSNYLFKLSVAEGGAAAEGPSCSFADMAAYEGTELYNAVAWGEANGYIKGYSDGNYYPEKPVSREEICAMIARYMRANSWLGLKPTQNITVFMDQDEFSAYTIEENNVVDCVKYGLIQGRETGRFDAKHIVDGETVYTTRQQMAAIFYRAAGHQVNTTRAYFEIAAAGGKILSVRVNMHYTAVVKVSDATINTASISVKGNALSRSFSKSFSTGMSENIELKNFLSNAFTFEGATMVSDIAGVAVTYNVWPAFIDEDGMTTIAFLPNDVAAIEEAWDAVSASSTMTSGEGNYVILTNGTSVQIGEQIAEFNRGKSDWTLDNFSDTATLQKEYEEYINIDTDSDAKIEIIIEKGLTVAANGKVGTQNEDMTITVEGIYAYELGEAIVALLEPEADLQTAGLDLIEGINALFGEMSGNHDMTLTVAVG